MVLTTTLRPCSVVTLTVSAGVVSGLSDNDKTVATATVATVNVRFIIGMCALVKESCVKYNVYDAKLAIMTRFDKPS